MVDPIAYLHLATPILLSVPLLRLTPSPPDDPPELPGVRPITVRIVTPRRGLTLLVLIALAASSALDAARVVAFIAASDRIKGGFQLWSDIAYAFGGLVVWFLTAIVIEWRAKWGDRGLISLGLLGMALDIPILVLNVIKQVHDDYLFNILAIPPSALRLLLLPILIVLVTNPIVRYAPASETTGLLSSDRQYGTFDGDNNGEDQTPKGPTGPYIPKKLGEVKKEDKPLSWREIFSRLKKLSPHLWPSTSPKLQLYVIICLLVILIGRIAAPLTPILLGEIIEQLVAAQNGEPSQPLKPFAAWMGIRLTISGAGVLTFLRQVLWVRVTQFTDREMQMLCFNHLLNLSLAYHTKRNTGEVLKVIDRGSAINNVFEVVLFNALPTLLDVIIGFFVFWYLYGGLLFVVTATVMAAYVVFSVTQTNFRMRTRRVLVDKDVKQRGIVSDVLTNWESVKYFTAEQRESSRYQDAVLSYQETEAKMMISFHFLFLVQHFIVTLGLALGSLIIAFRILNNQASASSFVVFTQYYAQLQSPLASFATLYRSFNSNTTDAEKMFNLLAQKTEVKDDPDAKELVITDGVIEFENVSFSYDGKVEALKNVSFKLGKGESLALVGESGSGKSTILRLLYRFYDIPSGRILIDGQDISKVTQLSLRSAIGIVPQDSVLWNDTIGANISYGKEGADDEEIIQAAKAARLHDRILGFPEQYETVVGERGVRLSGGEKQRVSLARMFLKSPAILVLDEATSALDTETEREIQRALADLARGRSSLSIAHRLSTIINSDVIAVMKDGQVIELGGYKELLEKEGVFAMMWKKQIFTDAEILALSGANSAVNSGSVTPKGSVKGNEVVRDVSPALIAGQDDTAEARGEQASGSYAEVVKENVEEKGKVVLIPAEDSLPVEPPEPTEPGENVAIVPLETPAIVSATEDQPLLGGEPDEELEGDVKSGYAVPTPEVNAPTENKTTAVETSTTETSRTSHTATSQSSQAPEPAATDSPSKSSPSPRASSRISFPPLPRMSTSASQRSDLSVRSSGQDEATSTAGGSNAGSSSNLPGAAAGAGAGEDKRRKRLSSLKGFVRRISDQGVSRSNSLKGLISGSPKSPAVEIDERTGLLSGQEVAPMRDQQSASGSGAAPGGSSAPGPNSASGTVPAPSSADNSNQNGNGQGAKKKNRRKGRK